MRILVVAHGFPPQAQGGSEIYAHDHARELASRGHEVLVLTREQDPSRPERALRETQQGPLRVVWVNNTFSDTVDVADSYEHVRLAAAVRPLISAFAPQAAHLHHLTCLSTHLVPELAEAGVPTVYTLHDFWLLCHRGQLLNRRLEMCDGPGPEGCDSCIDEPGAVLSAVKGVGLGAVATRVLPAKAVTRLASVARTAGALVPSVSVARPEAARAAHMRDICARISHFLAPSAQMRDALIGFGVDPARITWSPYGFDPRPFSILRPPRPAGPIRLGFVGSLMVSKAPHLLLEALAHLPSGRFVVHVFGAHADYHGDRSYRDRLAPLLQQPGVTVHGPRPHADMPAAFAEIDVLVVPSVWKENSPLVMHEALLSGVPVVASRVGGIPEVITHEVNGLLFEPGDVSALVGTLSRLDAEPDLLGRLARATTSIRTLADDVAAAEALYTRLLTENPRVSARRHVVAVVVNYRTPAATELAVRMLLASTHTLDAIIVVNNDDSGSRDLQHLSHPAVVHLDTGYNLGFSGGVNVGIREALRRGADAVLLVNSDAVVPPDCTARLDAALVQTPGAGIAGPVLVSSTHPDLIASAGISYDTVSGRMRHLRHGERVKHGGSSDTTVVDALSGCVLLIAREVFERAGLFDEPYFYSFEDIDFCVSARASGFLSVRVNRAVVLHHGGQSIGPQSPRRLYFAARNHLRLAARAPGSDSLLSRWRRYATVLALNLAHAVLSPGGSTRERLTAVIRGTRDYARGRFGPDN